MLLDIELQLPSICMSNCVRQACAVQPATRRIGKHDATCQANAQHVCANKAACTTQLTFTAKYLLYCTTFLEGA